VLSREGLARPEIAAPVALMVPVVTASGKLLGQKHWASDVLGGYLGGTAVAAAWLSAYEAVRGSKKMHG
jgi:membrane-associated phospholipid phosphatase